MSEDEDNLSRVKVKLVKLNGFTVNAWGLKKFLKANDFVSNVKQKKNKKKTIEAIKNS